MKALLLALLLLPGFAFAQSSAPISNVPVCYPRVKVPPAVISGALPAGVSTRFDTYSVWVCNMPTGYFTIPTMWLSSSNVLEYVWNFVTGSWSAAQAAADCAINCVLPTQPELDYMNILIATYSPKAVVAVNPGYKSRGVYNSGPNATLGAQVTTSRVGIGAHCYEGNRLSGTNFYSVQGDLDIANPGQTLGIVYAVCTLSFPIGAN